MLVSPFEVDSQLSYLSMTGQTDYILTDDSDVLVFGCCRAIIRLSMTDGCGKLIEKSADLWKKPDSGTNVHVKDDWPICVSETDFVLSCLLAGSDYFPGAKGVGLKTAARFFDQFKTLSKVIEQIGIKDCQALTQAFEDRLYMAYVAYRYARVWCPVDRAIVYIRDPKIPLDTDMLGFLEDKSLKMNLSEFTEYSKKSFDRNILSLYSLDDCLGNQIDEYTASKIAKGHLHPIKKVPYDRSIFSCFRNGTKSKGKSEFIGDKSISQLHQLSGILKHKLSFPLQTQLKSKQTPTTSINHQFHQNHQISSKSHINHNDQSVDMHIDTSKVTSMFRGPSASMKLRNDLFS